MKDTACSFCEFLRDCWKDDSLTAFGPEDCILLADVKISGEENADCPRCEAYQSVHNKFIRISHLGMDPKIEETRMIVCDACGGGIFMPATMEESITMSFEPLIVASPAA